MGRGVSDSEFAMWRAVFAFALVDNVLTLKEQEMLRSYKAHVDFSLSQLDTLGRDFSRKQDVEDLYDRIDTPDDRKRFCILARAIVWSDGNLDLQEKEIMQRVKCLRSEAGAEILKTSRNFVHSAEYSEHYSKAGVTGLFSAPHILELNL